MTEGKKLVEIVGADNVSQEQVLLGEYSRDLSFVPTVRPRYVVKPGNAKQVQEIVEWANETLTPLVPVSSGPPHFRGDTIPSVRSRHHRSRRMKRILRSTLSPG
jgi:hypothetical protein